MQASRTTSQLCPFRQSSWIGRRGLLPILATCLLSTMAIAAGQPTEKVLYRFTGGRDGAYPGELIMDAAGNLYGSAGGGRGRCPGGCGIIFKLSPNSNGGWTKTVLYSFQGEGDGSYPSGLVMDRQGNLYGATKFGGILACNLNNGCGTVFKLSPNSNREWTETVLHGFVGGDDGVFPSAGVTFDRAGNLYGTTANGGSNDFGTVYELSPNSDGTWTESVLYSFDDVGNFYSRVAIDKAGNLYGAATSCDSAEVYKLSKSGGVWVKSRIGSGYCMFAGVVLDDKGNVYGTDYCSEPMGVGCGFGAVFTLTRSGSSYHETYLPITDCRGGANPEAGLLLDSTGNFYGTTFGGGVGGCYVGSGVVFEFTHSRKGWKENVLHSFGLEAGDGLEPVAGLIRDPAGNFYGTTPFGEMGFGLVYEISPP